jgi:hypothetical protein
MRRARNRRWPKIGIGALALVVTAADLAVITLRDKATPVTFEDAVARFRDDLEDRSTSSAVLTGAADTTIPVGSTAAPDTTDTTDTTGTSSTSATSVATTGAAPDPTAPPPSQPGALRPAHGVYRYRTVGGEEIPFINAKRSYPDQTTATVLRGTGCAWHLRVDLLAEHTDEYELCTTPVGVTISDVTITIQWFTIRQSVQMHCQPPVPLLTTGSSDVRTTQCQSPEISATMRITPRPPEDLVIGGATVHAARVDWLMDIAGQFSGVGTYSMWLDPVSGLPLKVVRAVDAQGSTPIGKQRYVEHHTMTLLSSTPGT